VKPLFTVHAGEFLVGCEIEQQFRNVNVWIPAKDTGIDLLVSDKMNKKTVSLQIKLSRDYLMTEKNMTPFRNKKLSAAGSWTPERKEISNSHADYWIFVLVGFANQSTDFIIIARNDLLNRISAIHTTTAEKLHIYFWVTNTRKCWEARGLKRLDRLAIADGTFENDNRDFTAYLNKWEPIKALTDRST
jgi:hypothetical protein